MATKMRQPFTPGGKFIVGRPFRFGGKDYKAGDEFPWRQLSCSVRKLRSLYEGRNLSNFYFNQEEAAEQLETVENTGGGGRVDETPTVAEQLAVFDPDIHEIVNPERGQWFIADGEGTKLARLTGREAKRLRKATGPEEIDPASFKDLDQAEED